MSTHEAIVIGGGHNGLVAACYLARAGRRVLLLERRHVLGGASVTEEVVPGFRFSRLAYVSSLFRPRIASELRLRGYGFEVLPREPSSFTPLPDGRHLFLGPDPELNQREVARFSERDADALPRYESMLERIVEFVEPTLDRPPPDFASRRWRDLLELMRLAWRFRRLGRDIPHLVRMLAGPASAMLDDWFESEELKATLATDAIIGAMAAPSTPGTAYVLLHHVMGETNGARGVWGYVRGGLGGLTNALAAAARDLGVEIRTEASVREVIVEKGRAAGVVTESGEELRARLVLSNADPRITFLDLVPRAALPDDFVRDVENIDVSSASFKINLALSRLPEFRSVPGREPGRQHRGTIHISPTRDYIEKAFDDARRGRPSDRPVIEATIPSVIDDTLAPEGQHVMHLFVQYAPYDLAEGTWDDRKDLFADRCIETLEEYAPGLRAAIVGRDVISPLDMEREFSLTGGNIFHGAMTGRQLYFLRPVPEWARYRTPVEGLWLCGAGAHPGGGILGACGRNAALAALRGATRG